MIPSDNDLSIPPGAARCEHAARCAGCTLLDLPYEAGLLRKQRRLQTALSSYPSQTREVEAVEPAAPFEGYRTRAKWMVGAGGALGLYAREGDHEVVDISGCRVVSSTVARVGEAVRELLGSKRAPWLASVAEGGALRAVDIREIGAEGKRRALLTLVVEGDRRPSIEQARELAQALIATEPLVAGAALNRTKPGAPQVLGPETTWLVGERECWDEMGSSATLVTFGSFVQAHRGQATKIHAALVALARRRDGEATPQVLDLYGGSGAMAMALASGGAEVDTVESFAPASDAASRAAKARSLSVRALAGDAEVVARRLAAEGARYDLIVVNPPRRGLSAGLREALSALGAPRVAYVSCEPTTLARDLDHLARLGYRASRLWPLDMIPLTDEVETLAVLERTAPLPPRVIHAEDDAIFVEKGAHEPTTPQGEYGSSLLARVRGLPGMQDAVPVHRLDVGTSGVCLFAKHPSAVRGWAEALGAEGARKVYLAGVRGITSPKGVVSRPLREGAKMITARTRYKRLAIFAGHSIVEARPEQGRTHQIRRHFEGLGHPLLGDERYGHGPTNKYFLERHGLDRAFLHCASISLDHPVSGERLSVFCAPPGDLPLPPGFALDGSREGNGRARASEADQAKGLRDSEDGNE